MNVAPPFGYSEGSDFDDERMTQMTRKFKRSLKRCKRDSDSEDNDNTEKVIAEKDQLLSAFTSLKYEFIDAEISKEKGEKENCYLKEQVKQLGSSILALKSEVLQLIVTRKNKTIISDQQLKSESDLKNIKETLNFEREKSERISLELSKVKKDLERASSWTQSSQILSKLNSRTHSVTTDLGFKKIPKTESEKEELCFLCGLSKTKQAKTYMDSACSSHMIGDKLKFYSLTDIKRGSIDFENGLKRRICDLEKIGHLVIGGTMDEIRG
ncbi:hypothetical protein HAX54_025276 [Datura stramonium]|uniref:Uncharacterized protein n=1 Tax=Datura stramonium TaxID=4076 RepID=A0ABS8S7J1_DATST|nr:hypothetical protein [Datura stramonium]